MEYRSERSEGGYAAKALAAAKPARIIHRPEGNEVAHATAPISAKRDGGR